MAKQIGILVALVFSLAAINAFAQAKTWGSNFNGQIGDGTSGTANNRPSPTTISGLADVFAVGGGTFHSLVVKADGTVRSWGINFSGQLGDGSQSQRLTPVTVFGLTNVIAVSGGDLHSLALKSDGTVWAWGDNSSGQLGDFFTESNKTIPVQVGVGQVSSTPGFNNIIAIDAGLYHNLALKADGTVWAWGGNTSGQLGAGDASARYSPIQIAGLSNILAIGGGQYHSAALKSDGTVWVWGDNSHGQLGDGTLVGPFQGTVQPTPVMNTNISGVAQIAVGDRHTTALKSDGTVWSWGYNELGQIGNGTFLLNGCACVPTPTQSSIANVTDIRENNSFHILARKIDGSIWAWGYNAEGEAGIGTVTAQDPDHYSVLTPAQSIVGTGNVIFDTGRQHSMLSVPVVPVAAGAGIVARLGEATVTFANVTAPGNMTITAIDPGTVGLPPPATFVIQSNVQAYSIATTAVFDNATVCIKVPTIFDLAIFNSLHILHVEAGVLVDRTTTRTYSRREVCGVVTSFSPFLMATSPTPNLTGVSSRKAHGGAGTFNLPL